jgi:hypothetical protein
VRDNKNTEADGQGRGCTWCFRFTYERRRFPLATLDSRPNSEANVYSNRDSPTTDAPTPSRFFSPLLRGQCLFVFVLPCLGFRSLTSQILCRCADSDWRSSANQGRLLFYFGAGAGGGVQQGRVRSRRLRPTGSGARPALMGRAESPSLS